MKEKKQSFTIEEMQKQLHWEERHDDQTGTIKITYLDEYKHQFDNKYVQVGYLRIYGLNSLFDIKGYAVCDEVLHVVGYMLIVYFGENNVFRIGLDCFLIISETYDEEWKFIQRFDDYKAYISHYRFTLSNPNLRFFLGISQGDIDKEHAIDDLIALAKVKQEKALQEGLYYVGDEAEELREAISFYNDSRKDSLTGLLNRDAFIYYASKIINLKLVKDVEKVILYFNVENFKIYNENYGYDGGNDLIRHIGVELQRFFPNRVISRFSEDHFYVLTYKEDVEERIEKFTNYFLKKDITIKAGIYVINSLATKNIVVACDKAKLACDVIKKKYGVIFSYYNSEFDKALRLEQHIINDIDEAIEKGWIKIYFQPVVRTLSRNVCGFEVLSRWEDPEFGMIRPDIFIGILERYHLISKLTDFIIGYMCEKYEHYSQKITLFPVSINFSILDFERPDLLDKINEQVDRVNMPRQFFQIEVTESLLSSNQEHMKKQIKAFRDAGYSVWLDDFGSGYSSLNILKDYHIDTLKIDMLFLRNFSDRSRIVVEHIVNLAKSLGIHTLAEGVESEEQYQFLYGIGCEKIQGYYFGKPELLDSYLKKIVDGKIEIETQGLRYFFKDIGKVNVLSSNPFEIQQFKRTSIPICLFEVVDNQMYGLYANQAFIEELSSLGFESAEELGIALQNQDDAMVKRVSAALESLSYGEETHIDLVKNNNLMTLHYKNVAVLKNRKAFLMSIRNLSKDNYTLRNMRLNDTKQTIYALFDQVYLINIRTENVELIYSHVGIKKNNAVYTIHDLVNLFTNKMVYTDDIDRFKKFMNLSVITDILKTTNVASEAIRFTEDNTEYRWRVFELSYANNKDEIIFSIRPLDERKKRTYLKYYNINEQRNSTLTAEALWDTIKDFIPAGLFWKDTNRRFVGVNKVFRDYYDIKSLNDIIGKNDEEMGWHVDPDPYKNDEVRVLKYGERTSNVPGKCICHGENRSIAASKMPVYSDGKIVGLLGFFVDTTDEINEKKKLDALGYRDHLTGILNWNGMMINSRYYVESYHIRKIDFAVMVLNLQNGIYFNNEYGSEVYKDLIKRIATELTNYLDVKGIVGYLGVGHFVILKQLDQNEKIEDVKKDVLAQVCTITEVDRIRFTLRFKVGMALFSEKENLGIAFKDAYNRSETGNKNTVDITDVTLLFDEINKYRDMYDEIRCIDISTYKVYYIEDDQLKEHGICYKKYNKDKPCKHCPIGWCIKESKDFTRIVKEDNKTKYLFQRVVEIRGNYYALVFLKEIQDTKDL